jgi:N-formylglutamate amidohydrolase
MKNKIFLCLLLGFLSFYVSFAQDHNRRTLSDANGWMMYLPGNTPIVISVPHGGSIAPNNIPDRSCPDAVTVRDSYTIELAKAVDSVFRSNYKVMPHIIYSNLSRKKVDLNREIEVGTCQNEQMEEPWNNFHMLIDTAIAIATREFGFCFYIDLHAHGHPIQQLEMGYLLRANELDKPDDLLNSKEVTDKSSMRWLVFNNSSNSKNVDLLRGSKSLGTLLTADGFAAVPSQQYPFPPEGQKYFNGGYNTKKYTSYSYPNVFGLQIETNMKGVREKESRPLFAQSLSKNILIFLKEHLNFSLENNSK